MNIRLLIAKLIHTVRRDGVLSTYRRALAQLNPQRSADDFDHLNGTDTSGLEPLWRLRIESPNARFGERYEATGEAELLAALDFLGEDLRTFSFIDLGCGKGRTLLVAANRGFDRVVGVEFAHEFVEIATQDLSRRQIENAVVLHADAAEFRFPDCDMVDHSYNPFSEEVLRKVFANLRAPASRKRYVIYKAPRCADVMDDSGYLERFGRPPAAPHMEIWRATA